MCNLATKCIVTLITINTIIINCLSDEIPVAYMCAQHAAYMVVVCSFTQTEKEIYRKHKLYISYPCIVQCVVYSHSYDNNIIEAHYSYISMKQKPMVIINFCDISYSSTAMMNSLLKLTVFIALLLHYHRCIKGI